MAIRWGSVSPSSFFALYVSLGSRRGKHPPHPSNFEEFWSTSSEFNVYQFNSEKKQLIENAINKLPPEVMLRPLKLYFILGDEMLHVFIYCLCFLG